MSKTFETYIKQVDAAISKLTNGTIELMMLTDFSDGENALDEMFFEGLTPREAARRKLFADGYEGHLNCWSTECDFCEFVDDECPHVG